MNRAWNVQQRFQRSGEENAAVDGQEIGYLACFHQIVQIRIGYGTIGDVTETVNHEDQVASWDCQEIAKSKEEIPEFLP
ncbi:hypothetical protein MAR_019169 [Mya arenaria]|uniref:Uncharacterized protein n=1 Tax=Mya arenaria TaxID=6604 RepID=A0ABY7EKB1_MYAAR|nr:hypothetical protein MAR_019169 [Mya arenaria]